MMQVVFVGAGPGDPELLTIKGKNVIEEADVIIYAGSLVNPQLLGFSKAGAEIYNSASMTLEEVIAVIAEAVTNGKKVCRLHTGDPSIFGAIQEQMAALDKLNISYEVVPGVSSFVAAAAALKQEYTLPGVTQTVILTRTAGRTEVPAGENLAGLAAHGSTLCIFLSVGELANLVAELAPVCGGDTPVAVIYKASWPEQKIVSGNLTDIAAKVKAAEISKTAMIVVGNVLKKNFDLSKLYDSNFAHGYREVRHENSYHCSRSTGPGDSKQNQG